MNKKTVTKPELKKALSKFAKQDKAEDDKEYAKKKTNKK